MSYILDALNKADQARKQQQETSPTLPAQETSQAQPERSHMLPAGLLGLTITGLLFWLAPWQEEAPTTPPAVVTQPPFTENRPTEQATFPRQSRPVTQTSTEPAPVQQRFEETVSPANDMPSLPEPEDDAVPTLMALPRQLLDALPAINISAHTYSPEKHKRMVIINNKVLHENRPVSTQLLLRRITKEGVELEFNGTLFSMTTYDSWPY